MKVECTRVKVKEAAGGSNRGQNCVTEARNRELHNRRDSALNEGDWNDSHTA